MNSVSLLRLAAGASLLFVACDSSTAPPTPSKAATPASPVAGAVPADELILPEEVHFKHLWRLTFEGENAEAYWNPAGDRLVLQRRVPMEEIACDRIFVTDPAGGPLIQVSNGRGVTTCSYFLPDGRHALFGSTQAAHEVCPPKPDMSRGYVWPLYPEYDIYVHDLQTGEEQPLVTGPGYDTEATVSPKGDRIVFTSTRTGDVELWTCALDGSDQRQVTRDVGYDGGAFFSHDGEWLVFRTTAFTPETKDAEVATYRELLDLNLVKPGAMEIMVIRPDGTDRRQVTHLGKANWAPYFFPDDSRIVFCSNHASTKRGMPVFNLYAIDVDGENLERITYGDQFESFPMFSPDGRYLAFSSNRGGARPSDTNVFIAEWQ